MTVWTAEGIARLTLLWGEGKSAGQIGALMDISRNSVISKARRLRLASRTQNQTKKDRAKPVEDQRRGAPIPAPHARAGGRLFAELKPKECLFSVTDHDCVEHRFCGAPVDPGSPYCADHRKVCFVPPKKAIDID